MRTGLHTMCGLALVISFATPASPVMAQETEPESQVLFTNVNVFDGVNEKHAEGMTKPSAEAQQPPAPNQPEHLVAEQLLGGGEKLAFPSIIASLNQYFS